MFNQYQDDLKHCRWKILELPVLHHISSCNIQACWWIQIIEKSHHVLSPPFLFGRKFYTWKNVTKVNRFQFQAARFRFSRVTWKIRISMFSHIWKKRICSSVRDHAQSGGFKILISPFSKRKFIMVKIAS
jgi:hypothetical protein